MIQRHVYEVLVVKSEDGLLIADEKITATSSEAALAKVNLMNICENRKCSIDETEFVILKLGSLRAVQETVPTEIRKF